MGVVKVEVQLEGLTLFWCCPTAVMREVPIPVAMIKQLVIKILSFFLWFINGLLNIKLKNPHDPIFGKNN